MPRNNWKSIWEFAKAGDIDSIPYEARVKYYFQIRQIAEDFGNPIGKVLKEPLLEYFPSI